MRVLIADDHSIVRSGLSHLVSELGADVRVETAAGFPQLHQMLNDGEAPGLVVMDLRMPGFGGPDDLDRLVRQVAPAPVVIFSMVDSPDEMRAMMACGVKAFIPKSTDDAVIVNVLRLVLAGGVYIPPVLGLPQSADVPLAAANGPVSRAGTPFEGLTRRQMDVLDLMAQGLSNQEIGDSLGLNLSTVKTHVTGVLKVLGVESRTRAVLLVKEWGRERLT